MTWIIYASAALLEIAGCFSFWIWLREGRSCLWAIAGLLALAGFAFLLTRVEADFAGRAFAAYGGVYIAASIAWLWLVERQTPDRQDLLGMAVSLAGAAIILAPRALR